MEYPVDINTIAYWQMDEDRNNLPNRNALNQALAQTGLVDDFITNENTSSTSIPSEARAIDMGKPAALKFERTQPFTMSAWVFPINNSHIIFSTRNTNNSPAIDERGIEFGIGATGPLQLKLTNAGGVNELGAQALGAIIPNGTEQNVIVTYDGSSTRAGILFYVNGTLRGTTSGGFLNNLSGTVVSDANNVYIGRNSSSPNGSGIQASCAAYRHISIWNRVLSQAEVNQVFNAGTPPDLLSLSFAANLFAWWKLQTSDNFLIPNGVLDSASVGPFHGTAVGTARGIGWSSAASSLACQFTARIHGGPRLALGLGQDNCRWFDRNSVSTGGGTSSNIETGVPLQSSIGGRHLPTINKTMFGSAWTVEGWLYLNRAPSVTGVFESIPTAQAVIQWGDAQNLLGIQISTSNLLQAVWVSGSTRTATSNTAIPIRQWFHFAIIGVLSGGNRNTQFYISGADAGLVTGLPAVVPVDVANRWQFAQTFNSVNPQADQYWGGIAYVRLSNKARSLAEVQAAATDPANIVVDANTTAFWGFQENPSILDKSPNGNHLLQRSVVNLATPSAPLDLFAAQGPAPDFASHLFANSVSDTGVDSPMKQSVVDALCGTNEYTIECFFHPENNLNTNRDLYFASGTPNHTSDTDNLVLEWTLLTNRSLQVFFETEQRLMPADNLASVNTLAENLKNRFNSHRTNSPGSFHQAIDGVNPITNTTSSPPTALLNELKADFNAHILSTTFHGVADVSNTITSPNATGNTTSEITLANELQTKFHLHGINSGGNYHQNQDANIVATGLIAANTSASYRWFARSQNPAFPASPNQTQELGIWYHYALRKRNVGNLNYWKLGESAASLQAVTMGNAAAYSFERTTPFTLMIWVSSLPTLVGTPRVQHIIGKSDNTANPVGFSLFYATDGKLTFRMGNGGAAAGDFVQVAVTTASPGQLTGFEGCVAVTYDGTGTAASGAGVSGVKLFINGARQTNGTPAGASLNTGTAITSAPFTIGLRNLADLPFGGYVREASVWNRELTAAEMLEAFGVFGRPPPNLLTTSMNANLIGYWKFDQSDTGATVFDHSGNSINGTPQGGLAPTSKPSSVWDLFLNGQPLETLGPLPNPIIGDIFTNGRDTSIKNAYFLSPRNISGTTTKERRGPTRLSNIARPDDEILKFYNTIVRTTSTSFKMRAVDDAAPFPGYVYWIAPFEDFEATLVNTSTPPLVGNVVPGSVIVLTSWNS